MKSFEMSVPKKEIDVLKKYICHIDDCQKSYLTKRSLKEHLNVHYNIKMYSCEICPKQFTRHSSYLKHKKVHEKLKSHKCHYSGCSKAFTNNSNFNRHINTFHKQIVLPKPQNFKVHVHENGTVSDFQEIKKENFKCKFCNEKFDTRHLLQIHSTKKHYIKYKNQTPKFICLTCGKIFSYKSSLNRHIKKCMKTNKKSLSKEIVGITAEISTQIDGLYNLDQKNLPVLIEKLQKQIGTSENNKTLSESNINAIVIRDSETQTREQNIESGRMHEENFVSLKQKINNLTNFYYDHNNREYVDEDLKPSCTSQRKMNRNKKMSKDTYNIQNRQSFDLENLNNHIEGNNSVAIDFRVENKSDSDESDLLSENDVPMNCDCPVDAGGKCECRNSMCCKSKEGSIVSGGCNTINKKQASGCYACGIIKSTKSFPKNKSLKKLEYHDFKSELRYNQTNLDSLYDFPINTRKNKQRIKNGRASDSRSNGSHSEQSKKSCKDDNKKGCCTKKKTNKTNFPRNKSNENKKCCSSNNKAKGEIINELDQAKKSSCCQKKSEVKNSTTKNSDDEKKKILLNELITNTLCCEKIKNNLCCGSEGCNCNPSSCECAGDTKVGSCCEVNKTSCCSKPLKDGLFSLERQHSVTSNITKESCIGEEAEIMHFNKMCCMYNEILKQHADKKIDFSKDDTLKIHLDDKIFYLLNGMLYGPIKSNEKSINFEKHSAQVYRTDIDNQNLKKIPGLSHFKNVSDLEEVLKKNNIQLPVKDFLDEANCSTMNCFLKAEQDKLCAKGDDTNQSPKKTPAEKANTLQLAKSKKCMCKITKKLKHHHDKHCSHPMILHNDHIDYIVDDEIHYFNGQHCVSHGKVLVMGKVESNIDNFMNEYRLTGYNNDKTADLNLDNNSEIESFVDQFK